MNAPRKGDRGTYHEFNRDGSVSEKPRTGFTVHRVEGNLCWAIYDDHANPEPTCFIWRFRDGPNKLHDWPGKT